MNEVENRLRVFYFLFFIEISSLFVLSFYPRNDIYYVICGLFNLLSIIGLPLFVRKGLVFDFQILNLLALIVQGFGFISYWFVYPVQIYNYEIHLINLTQLIRLLIIRKGDADGFCKNSYWRTLVYHYYFNWFKIMYKKSIKKGEKC